MWQAQQMDFTVDEFIPNKEDKEFERNEMFSRQRVETTESRRLNREKEQGQRIPDAAECLIKYFRDEKVVPSEKTLLEFAANHSRIPSAEEFRGFTNDLLVRLCVKNGKRSEIFLKMDNEEFVEARR